MTHMINSWSKPTRYLVLVIMLAVGLWFVVVARDLIESLAIAALLAFLLNPLVTLVNQRAKVGRKWVVLFVYLSSLTALVVLGIIFIPLIPEQAANLYEQLQTITQQVQTDYMAEPLVLLNMEIPLTPLMPQLPALDPESFVRPDIILSAVQATTTNIGWLLVILVTSFYLLQDWARIRDWLFSWAPDGYAGDARRLYAEIRAVWNGYFRGQFRLSVIVGILTGIGTAVAGLPGAVIFGIAAGVMDVLLSVGPVMVMAVAALVALFAGSNIFTAMPPVLFALIVIGIFLLIQGIENVWLRPSIMGHSVNIHPAIVFVAIISSLALAGVLTALIIIPVLASVGVLSRYLYSRVMDIDPWSRQRPSPLLVETHNSSQPAETAVAPSNSTALSE